MKILPKTSHLARFRRTAPRAKAALLLPMEVSMSMDITASAGSMPAFDMIRESGSLVTPLVRALRLLSVFSADERFLSRYEIIERSGLPTATVYRLVWVLNALGYLHYEACERRFGLAPSALGLGYAAIQSSDLLQVALPKMQDLAERYCIQVNISRRDRLSMVVLQTCSPKDGVAAALEIGSRLGLISSVVGWALLAGLSEGERAFLLDKLVSLEEPGRALHQQSYCEAIHHYNAKGICLSVEESDRSVTVAVPLMVGGHEPLVLSCSGPTHRLKPIQIERELRPRLIDLVSMLERELCAKSASLTSVVMPEAHQAKGNLPTREIAMPQGGDMPRSGSCKPQQIGALAVARGFQVLRCFHANRMPLSHSDIVRRSGLPKATVSRLTSTLVRTGHLRHEPQGRRFVLGPQLFSIGRAFLESNTWLRRAQPLLQEVADALNVSVALAWGDGEQMVYIAYSISRQIITLRMGVGSVVPIATTSIGRAWLWGMSEPFRQGMVERLANTERSNRPNLVNELQDSFIEMSQTGVNAVLGGFQRDVYGVARPVYLGKSRQLFVLGCGAADVGVDLGKERARITPVLHEAASQLEALFVHLD